MDDEAPARGAARFGWRDLVRVWSSASDGRRLRRPTDVLLLIGSVLLLAVLYVAAPGPTDLDTAISKLIGALPDAINVLLGLCYTALSLWALIVLLLPLGFRGRRRLFWDLVLAAVVALLAAVGVGMASGTDANVSLEGFVTAPTEPVYLAVRLAVATAIIVTASPHLSRPLRYWGRIIIVLGAIATIASGAAWPIGAVAAVVVGLGSAAVAHLLLGSPQGLLTADQVEIALADLGVDVDDARDLPDEIPGEVLWTAQRADGPDLRVKVYGRDAWDTQAVGSAWAALTRRGEMPGLGRSRQSRVEHEALALLLAQRAGVAVLPLVAAGQSGQGDALIATEQAARSPCRTWRRTPSTTTSSTASGRHWWRCTARECRMAASTGDTWCCAPTGHRPWPTSPMPSSTPTRATSRWIARACSPPRRSSWDTSGRWHRPCA